MQNQKNPKKRGRAVKWDGRLAVTALAVGGTLGFWNLFSTQAVRQQATQSQPTAAPTQPAVVQAVEVKLPPLPTLVPPPLEQNSLSAPSAAAQPSVNVPSFTFQPGQQVLMGGSSPQVRRQMPSIITTTRSSQ